MAKKKVAKVPLWQALVDRGFFEDRKTATSWILSGKVLVNGQRGNTAGELIREDAEIYVKGIDLKYVGKGGLKLEGALADFKMDVTGKVSLDAGASTGGFTDCLLQHGASKVYAIDVGYGQLAGRLRQDKRVVNMERTNISDVTREQLDPLPSVATVDLSYLSLKKGIPIVAELMEEGGDIICLVKPLFEIEDPEARRTGEIKEPDAYRQVLSDLVQFVDGIGLNCIGVTHSPVTGNKGTREFFLWVSLDRTKMKRDLPNDIERAVEVVMKLKPYEK